MVTPPPVPFAAPAPAPTAAVLVIGNEILSGKVDEANVGVLAKALRGLGVLLTRVVVVPDEVDTIAHEVRTLSAAHDWLFTSGGVGPTHDDVTIEGVAKAFGVRVVSSPVMEGILRAHYGERCTEGHLRMALVPEGAALEVTTEVPWPTIRLGNTWLLPGIPQVFRMKVGVVVAALAAHPSAAGRRAFVSRAVYTQLEEVSLKPLLDQVVADFPDVSVGSYPKWMDPAYKTKLTFDGRDEPRVVAARDAFVSLLPAGEPKTLE
jgi:molybdenum cofactor synthesis domain-containing protein